MAERIAGAVVRRLQVKKFVDAKDEARARSAVRKVLLEDLQAEERLDTEARQILQEHTKAIKESAVDYGRLLSMIKGKLAKERGFIL
ncbi:MAG: DUF507 family protein [Candidatus Rokubacteria bacterium]|nr:DUF507 family protein [Candidatus Rokubacteria bacterium]